MIKKTMNFYAPQDLLEKTKTLASEELSSVSNIWETTRTISLTLTSPSLFISPDPAPKVHSDWLQIFKCRNNYCSKLVTKM